MSNVTLVSLSQERENKINAVSATFMNNGNIVPLMVNEKDRPEVYAKVKDLLEENALNLTQAAQDLFNLMSPVAKVSSQIESSYFLSNNVSIRGSRIFFGEERLEEALETHLFSLLDDAKPKDEKIWRSYVRFLDNLFQNANKEIREQLFRWMNYENKAGNGFGITDDGCIVGYKGCAGTILDPISKHSGFAIVDDVEMNGQIPNKVGSVIRMPRAAVQHDPSIGCSQGLHVGTRDYATKWAPILLLVKVNPRDVVSVPFECDSQKMRVCEYTVLKVTDVSEEHKMYHGSDDDFEADVLDMIGEEVEVQYYGQTYEGILVDTYTEGDEVVAIVSVEDEDMEFNLSEATISLLCDTAEENEVRSMKIDIDLEKETFTVKEKEDFEMSLEEAYELEESGEEVSIQYDGKEFTGVVTDVYDVHGKEPGVIVRSEDGEVKHIKLYRIEDFIVEDESEDLETFLKDMVDEEIHVIYDGDREFTGVISEVFSVPGKKPGVILRNADTMEVKHIKFERINRIEFEDTCFNCEEEDVCSGCEDDCTVEIGPFKNLLEVSAGTKVEVVYKNYLSNGTFRIETVVGNVKDVSKCTQIITLQNGLTINFSDIISFQVNK